MTDLVAEAVGGPNREQLGKFINYMNGRARLEDDREAAQETQAGIAIRILTSEDEDTLWEADEKGQPGGRDLVDVELRITGIDYLKSRKPELFNLFGDNYLIVHANRLSNGAESNFNTSAPGIVTKLVALERMGAFSKEDDKKGLGYRDCVIRGIDTGTGTVLKLRPIAARAI